MRTKYVVLIGMQMMLYVSRIIILIQTCTWCVIVVANIESGHESESKRT